MSSKTALKIIFGISLFGIVFSGTLTYQELFGSSITTCPSPGSPGTIFGYPACVYGLLMYIVIFIISGFCLFKSNNTINS